uniref:Uncharacterized protein n=1 Tax=Romanomermis culicivorax TaxID=13658 RepID=A0A915J9C6_ROMCU
MSSLENVVVSMSILEQNRTSHPAIELLHSRWEQNGWDLNFIQKVFDLKQEVTLQGMQKIDENDNAQTDASRRDDEKENYTNEVNDHE